MAVHAAELTQKVLLSVMKQENVAISLFLNLLIMYLPVKCTLLKEYSLIILSKKYPSLCFGYLFLT